MVANGFEILPKERELFIEQLQTDLKFIQLFFLLINKSCPIKNIDLVWAQDGPAGRVGLRPVMRTADDFGNSCLKLLPVLPNPAPSFCTIVNACGQREAESCAISDKAAEEWVGRSGRPYVYRCHAGLIDIAVPVICEGQPIATLLTGQVLKTTPSAEGFAQIRQDVARLHYIDMRELEHAYWQVPVVSEEDIELTTQLLKVCAEYLATSWKRLKGFVQDEQRRNREWLLNRKEFAHILLEGNASDSTTLRDLADQVGFTQQPDRVMVVRLQNEDEHSSHGASFDLAFTSALHAIEELCERRENICSAYLRNRGICIFLRDPARDEVAARFKLQALAQKILNAISTTCDMRARIGIGDAKPDWYHLADSYHEACMALAGSEDMIAIYSKPSISIQNLSDTTLEITRLLSQKKLREARVILMSLPLMANRHIGERLEDAVRQRAFFSAVLDSLCLTAQKLGLGNDMILPARMLGADQLGRASTLFTLQEAFLGSAEDIITQIRLFFSKKHDKIVGLACRIIDLQIASTAPKPISLPDIAARLGISSGHLGRTFRRSTGLTPERYTMIKRVEKAKRLLLDPQNNVSQVAELCGFSEATYFARVFRMILGCSPSEYLKDPLHYEQVISRHD